MKELSCPHCSKPVPGKPLKTWKFKTWDVKRYQCSSCELKFNLYQGPKSTWVVKH